MMRHRPGQYVTRLVDRTAGLLRAIWYRAVYLSWVDFGQGVVFSGPIRCRGVTGTISVGDRTMLGPNISLAVADGGHIHIASDVSINQGTIVSARHRISIGAGTRIGDHCSIRDADHRLAEAPLTESGFVGVPVAIGANVWIGRLVTIMPGITIGDGAVIGAHSLVTRDIPAKAIAFGTPAKVRGESP
jgi:acetyltransferase-like isoleucine patch superfamily enzyme